MPLPSAIRYTNTPRNGSRITKTHQPAFPQPLTSWRRKRSAKTVKRSQNQRIHKKNTNIDHITSPNEYAASKASSLSSRTECLDPIEIARREASSRWVEAARIVETTPVARRTLKEQLPGMG